MSGASRARTGDLVPARDALSQLSYGPARAKCSGEFEVFRPVQAGLLIVPRRGESKLDRAPFAERFERQEIAAVQVRAIGGERIYLVC